MGSGSEDAPLPEFCLQMKNLETFYRRLSELRSQEKVVYTVRTANDEAAEASCYVALCIDRAGKSVKSA